MRVLLLAIGLLLLAPTVSAEMFDSGDLQPGDDYSFTFTKENQDGHTYHCHPHPWMTGMVHVMPDTDGKVATIVIEIVEGESQDEWGYTPQHAMIEVGDTVTWINQGSSMHTVSEDEGTGNHDHDHNHMDHGSEDSPAPAMALLIIALAALAVRARR